jgi:extracellular solute-binding protein (family 3)
MTNRPIRVGIDDAPPAPMQLGNPDTGDFRGYEVDLLQEIGQRTGFELSFRRALWSVIVRELVAGDIDLVCSAATVTKEREREVDFCFPHLSLALAVVKRNGITGWVVAEFAFKGHHVQEKQKKQKLRPRAFALGSQSAAPASRALASSVQKFATPSKHPCCNKLLSEGCPQVLQCFSFGCTVTIRFELGLNWDCYLIL